MLMQHSVEELVYRALRNWFDTPKGDEPSCGIAVGVLSVHQTKLYNDIIAILRRMTPEQGLTQAQKDEITKPLHVRIEQLGADLKAEQDRFTATNKALGEAYIHHNNATDSLLADRAAERQEHSRTKDELAKALATIWNIQARQNADLEAAFRDGWNDMLSHFCEGEESLRRIEDEAVNAWRESSKRTPDVVGDALPAGSRLETENAALKKRVKGQEQQWEALLEWLNTPNRYCETAAVRQRMAYLRGEGNGERRYGCQ